MTSLGTSSRTAGFLLALGSTVATAMDIRQVERAQRAVEVGRAQTTAPAVLQAREADKVCGTGLQMCPSSASGGCCPEDYSCGTDSCYSTSRAPSTCGTLVGWYACDAVHGGSCCPDGWECGTADRCLPPSGSAYTFGCPASQYLCPASEDYGCCPEGMACGRQRCYSTEASTITTIVDVTTTRGGEETVLQSTTVTVRTPTRPTAMATVNINQQDDQAVFKYFPSAVAKVSPTVEPDEDSSDDGGGSSGGLTEAQLGGIVAGAVIFLIIVAVAAFFIMRRLNTAVAAFSNSNVSKQSDSSKPRPAMRQFRPTDSEIDALSVDPLMMSPQPSYVRHDSSDAQQMFGRDSPDPISTNPTPSSFAGGYQQVTPGTSRHTSFDAAGHAIGYFDTTANRSARLSQGSGITPPNYRVSADSQQTAAYLHVRSWSNGSDPPEDLITTATGNGTAATELEGSPYVAELIGSPTTISTTEERRRSSGSGASMMSMSRPPLSQRRRSDARSNSRTDATPPPNILGVVSEEIHGFHGPSDRMAGQTAHRPPTGGADGQLEGDHLTEADMQDLR